MVRGIQEGAPHKIIGIDESGNLGTGGRFCVLIFIVHFMKSMLHRGYLGLNIILRNKVLF